MRRLVLLMMALSAACLAGCSHTDPAAKGPTTKFTGPGPHDQQWASRAYQLNLYQIEAGQLASSQSTTDRVRNLARMMTRDYTELGDQLGQHAQEHHLALPRDLDGAHATYLQQLAEVPPGPDFDRSYLNLELKTHHELIDLYEEEANKGEFPGSRAVAQEALPDLYARERYIQQLRPGTWASPAKPTVDERNPKETPTTKLSK